MSALPGPLPQLLRRDSQCAIEFTGCVFPGDSGRQFYQSILIEKSAQSGEEFLADVAPRYGHCVGKLERKAFAFGIKVTICVIRKGVDLVVGNSELAAHGSIYVLSKLTTIEKGDAAIDQRSQTRVYQS